MTQPIVKPAVTFEKVTKRYGGITAVDAIDFSIASGTLVTLLGPSGCGKTTTLRMIAGLEAPSAGRILIGAEDVTGLPASQRDVSMVFQSYALFPHMTVMENVSYGLRAAGLARRRAEELAAEKLATVGLAGFERRLPSELSGGQQQRVAVARAIVLEPKVLLFDEPLSNLDVKLRRRVREDIRSLQQQLSLTAVYVTHDQEEALAVSDRIIVMRNARIVQDGTPRRLYEEPADHFIADFIGNANLLPVTAERVDAATARIRLQGVTLILPSRGLLDGAATRNDLALAVRPQAIRLRPGRASPNELGGIIRKAVYLGSHLEYEVALDGLDADVLVIDRETSRALPPETPVILELELQTQGAALVPADQNR
jgi:iron(III) transport system ATP-binding protein